MLDVDGIPETTIAAVEVLRAARLAEVERLAGGARNGGGGMRRIGGRGDARTVTTNQRSKLRRERTTPLTARGKRSE